MTHTPVRRSTRLLLALSITLLCSAATAACVSEPIGRTQRMEAPKLQAGATWSYTPGKDLPVSTLRLLRADAGEAEYEVNGSARLLENPQIYSDVNPLRHGDKVMIRFPLKLGDTWEDRFTEEGEYKTRYEHYLYDYEEASSSKAAAIERITVAAGTFQAIRIDRTAYWVKSHPRPAEGDDMSRSSESGDVKVSGITLTQLWYVPSLGRAVLKASRRVGDPHYADTQDLLRNANTSVIELSDYTDGRSHCASKPVVLARQPEQYFPIGYAAVPNDTWEWAFQMREHYPRRPR